MIDFTRAFETAWERTLVLLFRPFDPGKWCVIGLSAFLAGLLGGGRGANFSTHRPGNFLSMNRDTMKASVHHAVASLWALQTGVIVFLVVVFVVVSLMMIVLLYWLGTRGQFLLLDNVVRNRAALADPWRRYTPAANRVFFFYLICLGASFCLLLALGVPALVVAGLPGIAHLQWPARPALAALIGLGGIYLVAALLLFCFVFLFREWGIPLMFRNDLSLQVAVQETWMIIRRSPGSTLLFLLLRLALGLGLIFVSTLFCCCCCVTSLPYLNTVLLLPALLYIKCFSLDCLAQFGPEYDVWTVDVARQP